MIKETMSLQKIITFYDWIGGVYDWLGFIESKAKEAALHVIPSLPDQKILNIGLGTGKEHAQIQHKLSTQAIYGIDLSNRMTALAYRRTGAPICQANAFQLPFPSETFNLVYAAYVIDLIGSEDVHCLLEDINRVLCRDGRFVILSLTSGNSPASKIVTGLWQAIYSLQPFLFGGCRPVETSNFLRNAGFNIENREVIEQWAITSEIVVAKKP